MLAVAAASVLVAAGCAEEETATRTVTVVERVSEPNDGGSASASAEDANRSEPERAERKTSAGGGRDCITVPDVVGEDHQYAQDTMQAHGLYNLSEEDATGQGRMLIWDRNWTVVEQEPAAGECVSEDTTIILHSKKDDE